MIVLSSDEQKKFSGWLDQEADELKVILDALARLPSSKQVRLELQKRKAELAAITIVRAKLERLA